MPLTHVSSKGKTLGGSGPHSTTDGKNLDRDATNTVGEKFVNKPYSPNANKLGIGCGNHGKRKY
jgi:hypothetical protein